MSDASRAILDQFHMRCALLRADSAKSLHFSIAAALAERDADASQPISTRALTMMALYGVNNGFEDNKPFAFANSIAYIPITGVLLNRYLWATSYATGYNAIRGMHSAALADPDVKGIVFDVDTPGGMVQGCFELGDEIYAARGVKPNFAMVDANCFSAGYALASAASRIVAVRSAGVGSIGVVATHISYEKALKNEGVEVSLIFAGDHKVDGNPYESLTPEARKARQDEVNTLYGQFVATVARNRKIEDKAVRKTEARGYFAEEAMDLGLIDAIDSPIDAVAAFAEKLSGSKTFSLGVIDMTPEEIKAAQDKAVGEARTAERARIQGILGCAEAKDRQTLASHLASTDMSVADAQACLKAAAPEVAPVAAAAPTDPVAAAAATKAAAMANNFANAMDASQNPNVSANGGRGTETDADGKVVETPEQKASAMLALHQSFTGKSAGAARQ